MATSFEGWGTSWGTSWGAGVTAPGAMSGTASFAISATATLTDGAAIMPPASTGGGTTRPIGKPWQWVPFHPVPARRPRKRRDADVLFLTP